MGAGKSTIGLLLSKELNTPFYDIDKVIEDRAGANIPWIFDIEGEQGFRLREQQTIEDITQLSPCIIATGGGAVLNAENRAHLTARGTVVYLKTTVEQQLERTAKDKNRPLLQAQSPRKVLTSLMKEREPLYLDISDLIIHTDKRHPRAVASEIIRILEEDGLLR
ncbi:MAG: shikimate kinase AroK [Oceanospirillaceae bacterium]|nr:shikimate kinase AroK [Oceanospirillaceae bacterium]